MEKNKTGKSMGSEGRHIGSTTPDSVSRGHGHTLEEHQDAGSGRGQRQQQGGHDGSHAPDNERSDRPQRKG
jgi:hypothetical protein